jgi:NADH:ubiquinone oxidoreductase subunit 4 (subunit M)
MRDLSAREEWTLIPLVVMIFVIGLFPAPFFSVMSNSVAALLARLPSLVAAMH